MKKLNLFFLFQLLSLIGISQTTSNQISHVKSLSTFNREFAQIQSCWLNQENKILISPKKLDNSNGESEYAMTFNPLIGKFNGNSDIGHGINPNITLKSGGICYGLDWVSGRWVDEVIPKLQVPMRIRYLKANENGLKTSDGTAFPIHEVNDKKYAPFTFFDFAIDLYISPWPIEIGKFKLVPRFGVGIDLSKHSYDIDVRKYLGKTGTDPNLGTKISALSASYDEPFYNFTFYSDLYGINLGTYFLVGEKIMIDAGWEYYPVHLMTKALGDVHSYVNPYHNDGITANSVKLTRIKLETRYWIKSPVSIFLRFENSSYNYNLPNGINDMGITILDNPEFFQRHSVIYLGLSLGYFSN